jgi:hypothetical protein
VAEQLHELSAQALVHLRALLNHPDTPSALRLKTCLAILERVGYPTTTWDFLQDQDNAMETPTGARPLPLRQRPQVQALLRPERAAAPLGPDAAGSSAQLTGRRPVYSG